MYGYVADKIWIHIDIKARSEDGCIEIIIHLQTIQVLKTSIRKQNQNATTPNHACIIKKFQVFQ